jgi:cell division septal protein FtsQ
MLLAKIKKLLTTSGGRKQPGRTNGYLQNDIDMQSLPGQSSRQAGQYTTQKKRLDRFRQILAAKQRTKPKHQGYNTGTAAKSKIIFKITGLAAVSFSLLLFVFLGGWQIVLKNIEELSFFQVSEVVYSGMESIAEEKLREASGIIVHRTSLIGLDCHRVEASLLTVPWVARAVVKRNWPSTVEITIVENVPVALLHNKSLQGAQLQYIDKKGVPFLQVKPGADIDYPVVTGLTEIADSLTREKALAEVLVLLKNINNNNPYLPAQSVSEVHLKILFLFFSVRVISVGNILVWYRFSKYCIKSRMEKGRFLKSDIFRWITCRTKCSSRKVNQVSTLVSNTVQR